MMKKSILILMSLLLLLSLPVTAFAAGDEKAELYHVTDLYGLLSTEETGKLESLAENISSRNGCSVYVLVVKDYRDYDTNTFDFAKGVFSDYKLGWGEDKEGVMLMLSMADRDYELIFHGPRTENAFTEYGRDRLEDRMLRCLRENRYYDGFVEYMTCCDEYLTAAENGKPVDYEKGFSFLFFLPGLMAAGVTFTALYVPMHSAGIKREAGDYITSSKMNLRDQRDVFVNRTVHRRPRNTESSGGSHGSSHSGGGYSGRSGKF